MRIQCNCRILLSIDGVCVGVGRLWLKVPHAVQLFVAYYQSCMKLKLNNSINTFTREWSSHWVGYCGLLDSILDASSSLIHLSIALL